MVNILFSVWLSVWYLVSRLSRGRGVVLTRRLWVRSQFGRKNFYSLIVSFFHTGTKAKTQRSVRTLNTQGLEKFGESEERLLEIEDWSILTLGSLPTLPYAEYGVKLV